MPENRGYVARPVTGLSRKEFLIRLNGRVKSRYGISVSHRMLSSWCEDRLMAAPIKIGLGHGKGSQALWDALSYRSACRICRLKGEGADDVHSLRILLWLSDNHITVENLRYSCIRWLRKQRQSRMMSPRSLADPTRNDLSENTIKRLAKSLGRVGSRLVPEGLDYSNRDIVEMFSVAKGGKIKTAFAKSLTDAVMPKLSDAMEMGDFVNVFAGILAVADESENSGEQSLEGAELRDFREARKVLYEMRAIPKLSKNPKVKYLNVFNVDSLVPALNAINQQHYFRISTFVMLVTAMQRKVWPPTIRMSATAKLK